MAEFDYTNWEAERAALKTEIYRELREKRDRERVVTISGSIELNPQYVTKDIPFEYGPFLFPTPFSEPPILTFSAVRTDPVKPFWGFMDISRWQIASGTFEGFYIGFYAIQTPPAALYKHIINWIAQGKASVYHESAAEDAWTAGYDHSSNPSVNLY